MFLFINMRWLDGVDILLVAVLIYQLYNLVKGTVAIRIFIGILSIYILWKLMEFLKMEMLGEILGQFIGVGVIALLIVFQQELRRFLIMIGTTKFISQRDHKIPFLEKLFRKEQMNNTKWIDEIVLACKKMGSTKTGALIAIGKYSNPVENTMSGVAINASVNAKLIEAIFVKESPLHDGAMLIYNNNITHVRAVLPVTENPEFPDDLGMRHRSAVGLSEVCEAIIISVSEQNGKTSVALNGELKQGLSEDQLRTLLTHEFTVDA